ncbi:hypothetical protein EGT74_15520 [Chitinophaga lutea]|uniref:Sensor histidine kinase n=1 Tax=Chitinophaga lutea TaxID=2488634 RepID=A0A3N4Q9R1_9BACT|nr:hypothetical protein [Chitinophaga lutea]RPE08454.1 hypothetical protein EGT74_15520 [Chitinophaga lutea]
MISSSTGASKFPENKGLIEDVFHEIRSILSGILSSVELIELYGSGQASTEKNGEKINRQAGAIKSQVIELEFLLQNVRIIQHILNNSLTSKRAPTKIALLLKNVVDDDRYAPLFADWVSYNVKDNREVAYVDEFLVKQLLLNMLFRMQRNSVAQDRPQLSITFEKDLVELKGIYTANANDHSLSSSIKTFHSDSLQAYLDQRICSLIAYVAELHDGRFDITALPDGKIEMLVTIPYDVN